MVPRNRLLVGVLVLAFILGWAYVHDCPQQLVPLPKALNSTIPCQGWRFERYDSSPFEEKWLRNADAWGNKPCDILRKMTSQTKEWVQLAGDSMNAPLPSDVSSDVLSSFWYRGCDGALVRVPIEPIGGVNRHPFVCTETETYLGNKNWLVIDWKVHATPPAKSFMFDVGASTWHTGKGGVSQSWMWEHYKRRGISFAAFYAWEAKQHPPKDVWAKIPLELRPVYHWLNIPAETTKGSLVNPLEIIRLVTKPEDFVVLKLDIDAPTVEMPLLEQLSNDPELLALVDEFYFEHHVNMEPLASCCWSTTNMKETGASSYRLFAKLRQAGVRAHSWV